MENKTDYVTISLSLHLIFARLMKEHAFFLENSFMPKDKAFSDEAAYHKKKFEKLKSYMAEVHRTGKGQHLFYRSAEVNGTKPKSLRTNQEMPHRQKKSRARNNSLLDS